MKRILIILLSVLSLLSCEEPSQKEEKQEKDTITQSKVFEKDTIQKIDEPEEYNSKCSILSEMPKESTISSLISKTTRVEVISFELGKYRDEREAYTKIKNNKVVLDKITKRVNLNKKQIQKLFDVLFKYKGNHTQGAKCYEPNDVLVFYNQGQIIAFLEICFSCKGTRSYGVVFTDFCDEKWEKLREFF
jgi:hypothetical protein